MPSSTETYRLIKVPAYGNCGPQALAESVVALIQNTDYKIPKDTYKEIIRAFQDFLAKLKTDSFVDKFLPDMKFDNAWANPTKEQEARKALTTAEKVFKENPSWDNFEYILRQVSISEADKHALCIVLAIGLRKLGVEKAIEAEQKKNGETSDASTREYLIKLEKQFENSEPVYNDVLEEAAKLLNLGLQMVGVLDEVPPSSETTGTQSKIYKINEEYKQQPLVNGDGKAGTIVVQYTENPKHFNPLIPSSFSSAVATSVSNSADSESRSKIVSSNLRKVIYGGSHIMPNQSKPTSTGAGASAALAATPVFSHNLNPLTPTSRADTPVTGASKSDASGNSQFPYSPTIIAPNPQDGYSKLRHEPIFAPTPPPTANSSLFDDAFNQLITALNRAGFSYKLVNTSGISQGSIAQYTHGFYNITRYSEAVGRCLFEPLNIATIDSSKNQTLNVLRHILSGMQCASINQNNDSLLSDDNTTLNIISEIASSINERKSVNLSLRLQQLYYIGLDSEIRNLQNAINSFTANKTYTAFVKKISEKCSQLAQNLPSISEQLLSTDECFSKISLE